MDSNEDAAGSVAGSESHPQPEDSHAFQQLLAGDVMSLIKAFAGVLTARDLLSGLQCF